LYEDIICYIIVTGLAIEKGGYSLMPIYKAKGKKNGLQKYIVRINYISDSGEQKQLSRMAYGLDMAKNLEMNLLDKLKNKGEMPTKKMTVQELYNEYIEVKTYELRKRTIYNIKYTFKTYFLPTYKNYRLDKITVKEVQNWKISMEKRNLALNTKRKIYIFINAMMNYAVKMEYFQKNPFTKMGNFRNTLNIKSEMSIYTPEEFKKFITAAKESAEEKEKLKNDLSEWDYYVFFGIAFYTGLRKGEIHALKWSDIDGSYLTVNRSITQRLNDDETAPKNRSSIRTLEIPLPLKKVLGEHKKRQQRLHNFNNDFRICSNIRDSSIYRKQKNYSDTAGVKNIRIHDFRHSHASLLANSNINIQEIARRLGHAQIEITWNTYCHLYPREEEKAIAILNRVA